MVLCFKTKYSTVYVTVNTRLVIKVGAVTMVAGAVSRYAAWLLPGALLLIDYSIIMTKMT
jgi:hypothetical protein